jgi:hypothetical protein
MVLSRIEAELVLRDDALQVALAGQLKHVFAFGFDVVSVDGPIALKL